MPAAIGEPTRKPIAWAAEWMLTYLPLAFVPPLLFSKAGLLHLIAPLVLVAAARSWAGLVSGRSGCGFRGAALARWDRSIAGPRDNGRPCPLPPCSARGLDRGRKFIDQRARPCVCVCSRCFGRSSNTTGNYLPDDPNQRHPCLVFGPK